MKVIDEILLKDILWEIKNNNQVTEIYLANKYLCSERTIRRYIKILKNKNLVKIEGYGRKRKWIV